MFLFFSKKFLAGANLKNYRKNMENFTGSLKYAKHWALKSVNLQYNTLGCWVTGTIVQLSNAMVQYFKKICKIPLTIIWAIICIVLYFL